MGAAWISWRTTIAVIFTILQIRGLTSVITTKVYGVEGQTFDFSCEYPHSWQSNAKYFCLFDDNDNHLIRTDKHDQWETEGRFSLYDNTTGAFFIVRVDKLVPGDSGIYWCGVDVSSHPDHISAKQLYVSRVNLIPNFTTDPTVDKLNKPLFLTAVMCVAAILFVFLFTLCLLWAVKRQRLGPRQNRETSSDYETMTPGVGTEPEHRCTCLASDCAGPSGPPPPDLCSHVTPKHRDSAFSLNMGEYADVDAPGHICQYQHLDRSRLEDHVYHRLHANCAPKDGTHLGDKEQINC